jgi:hypothetical protein
MLKRYYQPGYLDDEGEQKLFDLRSNFGWHDFPLGLHDFAKQPEVLSQYGVGISFYFKLLKALICILAVMNVFTIPSMIMYSEFSAIQPQDRVFNNLYKPLERMTFTTIGSLGPPIPSCRQASENEMMSFSCPGEGVIQSVIAYYGQPYGSCTCPGLQQTDANGNCFGKINTDAVITRKALESASCLSGTPCFVGTTRFGGKCCSLTVDATSSLGSFKDLDINPNYKCNSLTAPFIATGLCQGKRSCAFNLSETATYSFPTSKISGANTTAVCSTVDLTGSEPACVTSLQYGGNFNGCNSATLNMIFEAICVEDHRTINESKSSISYRTLVQTAIYLDALSILAFICGVVWIRAQQKREDRLVNASICRAKQYTV